MSDLPGILLSPEGNRWVARDLQRALSCLGKDPGDAVALLERVRRTSTRKSEPSDPDEWPEPDQRTVLNELIDQLDLVWGINNLVDVCVDEPGDYVLVLGELIGMARAAANAGQRAEHDRLRTEGANG